MDSFNLFKLDARILLIETNGVKSLVFTIFIFFEVLSATAWVIFLISFTSSIPKDSDFILTVSLLFTSTLKFTLYLHSPNLLILSILISPNFKLSLSLIDLLFPS